MGTVTERTPLEYARWVLDLEEEALRLGWPDERRQRPAVLAMAQELVRQHKAALDRAERDALKQAVITRMDGYTGLKAVIADERYAAQTRKAAQSQIDALVTAATKLAL